MSAQIDFRTLPANVPILCIPRVYPNVTESRIRKVFDDLDMGILERVDIVSKKSVKGENFNRVFVHFKRWNNSENANITRERLLNGKDIKIIYDDPWFWKISAYREPERRPNPSNDYDRRPARATLRFDSDEEKTRQEKPRPRYEEPRQRRYEEPKPRREDSYKRPTQKQQENRRDDSRERPVRNYDNDKVDINADGVPGVKVDYGNVMPPARKRQYTKNVNGTNKETNKETKEETKEDGEV